MRLPGSLRATKRALAVTAATLLSIPLMASVAFASPASATAHQPTGASPATVPHVTQHPTKHACISSTKAGFASCMAIGRTDVTSHKGLFTANDTPAGYGPADLQGAYNLPSASAGAGQTVAIVDAFDDPNAEADLQVYRAQYGLPVCSTDNGCFRKVAQDGSTNYPSPDAGWSVEISLDLDMVSATCPLCHILLVEANDNSFANLGTSVNEAVTLGAKYVSNSYGGGEDPSETASDATYYDHPGVAVTASSGDGGYGVEYPAASHDVTAVGGTTLTKDSTVARGWTETAWSGAGSGCSAYEPKPSWQTDSGCSNRAVADVSADADPNTGVAVYVTYQANGWSVWGGTSVASPIIASTFALAGAPVAGTYPSSYPYADTSALYDVTTGSNGQCSPAYLCTAGTGYDGPTGLGTPDGVTAFTTGPHGDVSGTVTDSATGKPIADAEVDVGDQPARTSSTGGYDISVPVGTYDVTAKDYGYASQTVSGVQVSDGQTTTENFALQTVPSVTLTGHVSDGSGQGWPLYAKVSVPGTPAVTYTDPATGAYSLTLPDSAAYNVTVDAVYPGYTEQKHSVQVGTTDLTQDFSVPVDAYNCDALGYHLAYDGATQTFDGSTAPDGWSVVNAPSSTGGWEFDNPASQSNLTGGSGNFAVANSDTSGASYDTELVSPVMDLSGDTSPYLQFNSDLAGFFGDTEGVDVSVDGGQTWTNVWQSQGYPGKRGPDLEVLSLPMAAGQSQVQARFHYVSKFGYWWQLDNVFMGNRTCVPSGGGLVEGIVKDGNTGAGVNGAKVSGATATATTAAGDSALGDGFYYLFAPQAGSAQFTAAKSNYVSASGTANVTANAATTLNLTMQAGRLSVTPGSVSKTVGMGASTSQNVTYRNTGHAPVNVKFFEQPGGFTLLGAPGDGKGAALQRVNGTYSPLSLARAGKSGGGTPSAAQPYDAPWIPVANYPTKIMDNGVATDTSTGMVYSVGGTDGRSTLGTGYVYDPGTQAWTALPAMKAAREAPQAAFINGKLYVVGGWGVDGNPVASMEIYDPGSGSWSAGASIPVPYAGSSVAVLNGSMYVIGGCDGGACGHNDVQIYNPGSNSWSAGASYPENISWQACGGITGEVYCAGGTAGNTDTKDAYVYNPGANSWSPIAPLPIDLWASGYAAANGQLLVSGGVTNGFATVTNQGYAYSPAAGSWTALPNSNNADYRAGSACGLYRIGGSTQGFTPQVFAELLPGYASCGVSDVPWLSQSQTQFTVNPGKSVTVTVTLNAGDPSVTQPGAYTASLITSNNTPYSVAALPVTMNATPPRTWGKITGTISGLACGGAVPLAGATVQVDSWANSYTLKTDKNGLYGYWLDVRNNPLTFIVALDGWQPQTTTVKITRGGTVTTNFSLKPDQACS